MGQIDEGFGELDEDCDTTADVPFSEDLVTFALLPSDTESDVSLHACMRR